MSLRWAPLGALALLLASCGVPGQDQPTKLENDRVRVAPPSTTTTLAPGVHAQAVQLCFIAGDRIVVSSTNVATPASVADVLDSLADVSRTALPAGTRSAINGPGVVAKGVTRHGVANVDLGAKFLEILPADQILAIAQIVCTLTGLPGIGQVRFTQQGHATEVPRADSSLTDAPVSRDDYRALLAPSS